MLNLLGLLQQIADRITSELKQHFAQLIC